MKTTTSLALISIGFFFMSCENTEPILPSGPPDPIVISVDNKALADFVTPAITWVESATQPVEIRIRLSKAVEAEGKVVIAVSPENADQFTTDPHLANGVLILNAAAGDTALSFKVQPLNDGIVRGHTAVTFGISYTEGSIVRGSTVNNVLTIQDDELALKVMGYETTGARDFVKRTYEYDSKGRIAKVNWETRTPNTRSGTETWYYNDNDQLIRINKYPGRDVHYTWDGNKIYKAEVHQDNAVVQFTIYSYDAQGNIAGQHPYHKQADGSFKLGPFKVFLYFTDGNIYKSLTYTQEGEEEPVLLSTKTYDNYVNIDNPFPMVEILPNVKSQTKLATTYRVEENGFDFSYTLTYEFRDDGLPAKRIATAAGVSETTVYRYY